MALTETSSDRDLLTLWLGHQEGRRVARMLERRGGLASLADVVESDLDRALGPSVRGKLVAATEILRRARARAAKPGDRFASAADVVAAYGPRLAPERRERFLALALDAKNRLRSEVEIAVGSLSSCPVHPREAFRPLVRAAASGVIFVHNHPSGDPTPSEEDREITERLRQAGAILGIRVLDHVIVGAEGGWSFTEGRRA